MSASERNLRVEWFDPAPLRPHPLHKFLPEPDVEGGEWHAFVDALSACGPEGIAPINVTAEGLIIDGARRWRAARQLQWAEIGCIVRPEWEAAAVMVESVLGQRNLSKGCKVYLCLPLLVEYEKAAESRRLMWLKKGVKILQKPLNSPLGDSVREGKASDLLGERLGCCGRLVRQAIQIRKFFELPGLREHRFEFQDGTLRTLKEHFEPLLLDGEHPMGLGEVLKGIGWFVDERGVPKQQAPPERNSHLFYFCRAWQGWGRQCQRWEAMGEVERKQALEAVGEAAEAVPEEVLVESVRIFRAERRRRKKNARRQKPVATKGATKERKEHKEAERAEVGA